jgi:hypothetical protein
MTRDSPRRRHPRQCLILLYLWIMPNAAFELAKTLDSWKMSSESAKSARSRSGELDGVQFWRSQASAVELLREVDRMIDSLRRSGQDVTPFEDYVEEYYQAVFSYEVGWQNSAFGAALDAHALNSLRFLGMYWDAASVGVSPLEPAARTGLLGALIEARDALLNLPTLSQAEREYVYRLVDGAHSFIDEHETLGSADLRQHVERVSGALLSVVAQLPDEDSESRQAILSALGRVVHYARGGLQDAAAMAAIAAVALQPAIGA